MAAGPKICPARAGLFCGQATTRANALVELHPRERGSVRCALSGENKKAKFRPPLRCTLVPSGRNKT